MFDGVPEQFHQFIASSATTLPLSFPPPLHTLASPSASSPNGFTSFDPLFSTSNSHHHRHHHQVSLQLQQPDQFLHPLQHQQHQPRQKINDGKDDNGTSLIGMNNIEVERERSMSEPIDNQHPWSSDEVLALLRIRSSMENWFPEFSWEHVSRKLAELGFKRSAEKCKEKFEEESRYFNTINCSKSYRIYGELEEFCQQADDEKNKSLEKSREDDDQDNMGHNNLEDDSRNNYNASDQDNEKVVESVANHNKRRSQKKFEMLKGFCEDIVNKLMAQQEELQNKLIEDMVKRDEEKVAREEAWKKQEMDRMNHELELRAKEQAVAGDRQAMIIKFLSKFSFKKQCLGRSNIEGLVKVPSEHPNPSSTSSSLVPGAAQNPNPNIADNQTRNKQTKPISMAENQAPQNPNPKAPASSSSAQALAPQNPNSVNSQSNPLVPPTSPLTVNKAPRNPLPNHKEDPAGKRWPRDEVLALINLRCSLYNNGDNSDKEGAAAAIKGPLWERISQGMLELGYKRSAKRCKEKWENINKYYRKTKDVNKKRSLDCRTCPYFHQLSTLYNQGTLIAPSEGPENRSVSPENHSDLPETGANSSENTRGAKGSSSMQVPAFEFEF
ncbi:hypothetical protein PTKIN_Ptkin06aG0191200 [Pterospermum kingtungense]